MCHVCLHDGEIAATNAHLLYWEASDLKLGSDLLLNKTTIKLMEIFSGAGDLALSIGAKHFKLENDAVVIIQRIVDENYPKYRDVLPTGFKTSVVIGKKLFSDTVSKADKMANKVTRVVIFDIGQNSGFKISSKDFDLGTEYSKDLSEPSAISGDPLTIGFNAKFLQQICAEVDKDELSFQFQANNRAAVINGNLLIMPVEMSKYQ